MKLFSIITTLQTTFAQCVRLFLIFETVQYDLIHPVNVIAVVRRVAAASGTNYAAATVRAAVRRKAACEVREVVVVQVILESNQEHRLKNRQRKVR